MVEGKEKTWITLQAMKEGFAKISNYQENIKIFLEKESQKFSLGSVFVEEKEYSDFDPVFVINVPENMSFDEIDKAWDTIIDNTEKYINFSNDKKLINFSNNTFITLRK